MLGREVGGGVGKWSIGGVGKCFIVGGAGKCSIEFMSSPRRGGLY